MVLPLEAVELIKNYEEIVKTRCSRETGLKANWANAISLQQIQEGNVDLFHPKMKKDTKHGQKQ